MKTLKYILLLTGVFVVAAISAFFFFDSYRDVVKLAFEAFNENKIAFYEKGFLFPSNSLIILFGLFCATYVFLIVQRQQKRFATIGISLLLFFVSTLITSYVDSKVKVANCRTENGEFILAVNSINFYLHFYIGLTLSLLPVLTGRILKRKR